MLFTGCCLLQEGTRSVLSTCVTWATYNQSQWEALWFRALKQDSRNFHAWKHRREIVKLSGTDVEDELAYSRRLIEQQPSNYSAWHARSALLTEKYSTQSVVTLDDLLSGPSSGRKLSINTYHINLRNTMGLMSQSHQADIVSCSYKHGPSEAVGFHLAEPKIKSVLLPRESVLRMQLVDQCRKA